jgi:hypothetical protein
MAVTLGKNVTITGITNARSVTVNNSAAEIDVTKFGDTSRKFRKALIEQTVEVECVDDPGLTAGNTFTLVGPTTSPQGGPQFVVTSVAKAAPIDGIQTWTVSASRAAPTGP